MTQNNNNSVIVSCEFRFSMTPDGRVWTPNAFDHGFWQRYLSVFSQVIVLARVNQVDSVPDSYALSSGDQVKFHPLPHYIGLGGLLKTLPKTLTCVTSALKRADHVIMRAPSQLSMLISTVMWFKRRRFALEVVGDPYDVFSAGVGSGLTALPKNGILALFGVAVQKS